MAYSTVVRTLRDGAVVIKDGDSPANSSTVSCDEGDLSWTENQEIKEIRCRGSIDHRRRGDVQGFELSFTMKWKQLIQNTETSADPITPYELINNRGSAYTSTEDGIFALDYEFTVTDITGVGSELITFPDVVKQSLDCKEGDEANTIAFKGKGKVEYPTVERV